MIYKGVSRGALDHLPLSDSTTVAKLDLNSKKLVQSTHISVRFARLSHIRRLLGGKPEEVEVPFDGSKFAEDDEYLILDIVINWVSLCSDR